MTSDAHRTVHAAIFLGALVFGVTTIARASQTSTAPAPQTPQAAAAAPAPPKVLAKMLDKRYPHWQIAPFAPGSDGCAAAKAPSPSVVNLDVNNDGFGDWAMQIQEGANVKFIVAVGWLQEFHVYEIDTTPGSSATRALSLVHRGAAFMNPATGLQDFFSNDSVLATPCTGAPTVYRWNGDGFTPIVLQASAALSPRP